MPLLIERIERIERDESIRVRRMAAVMLATGRLDRVPSRGIAAAWLFGSHAAGLSGLAG